VATIPDEFLASRYAALNETMNATRSGHFAWLSLHVAVATAALAGVVDVCWGPSDTLSIGAFLGGVLISVGAACPGYVCISAYYKGLGVYYAVRREQVRVERLWVDPTDPAAAANELMARGIGESKRADTGVALPYAGVAQSDRGRVQRGHWHFFVIQSACSAAPFALTLASPSSPLSAGSHGASPNALTAAIFGVIVAALFVMCLGLEFAVSFHGHINADAKDENHTVLPSST
jgi:hypothetical protein